MTLYSVGDGEFASVPTPTFGDRSLIEQARVYLIEEALTEEIDTPGFKSMLAETLIQLDQANQLKRIADGIGKLTAILKNR